MTSRERLWNVLTGGPRDRLAWTTLVDENTLSLLPNELAGMGPMEFYRYIGCDILQFGNYCAPEEFQYEASQCVAPDVAVETETLPDGSRLQRRRTPWGTLTSKSRHVHPVKYPVQTLQDVRVLTNICRHTRVEPIEGHKAAYRRLDKLIGDDGLLAETMPETAVQTLLQYETGVLNFYFLLQDHAGEVEELIDALHSVRLRQYEIMADRSPADVVISVENTSTAMISPEMYDRYSLPQVQDFVRIMHAGGKKAVLHMCGHCRGLLNALKQTGMDAWHAATPPPLGDTPMELILDELGSDFPLFGAGLQAEAFANPNASPADIHLALDEFYTPRVRSSNVLMALPADGLPVPLERFLAVRDWMETNGNV